MPLIQYDMKCLNVHDGILFRPKNIELYCVINVFLNTKLLSVVRYIVYLSQNLYFQYSKYKYLCVYWNYRAFVLDGCLIEAQIYSCQCNGSWTMMSKRKRGFEKNVKLKNKYKLFFLVLKNYQRCWVCNVFVDRICYWFSNMKWRYLSI